jgi:hypothetical protein
VVSAVCGSSNLRVGVRIVKGERDSDAKGYLDFGPAQEESVYTIEVGKGDSQRAEWYGRV